MVRISDRDNEAKVTTPVSTHCALHSTASTSGLVGRVNIRGNLNKVSEKVGNVLDDSSADICELECNVLPLTAQSKLQLGFVICRVRSATQNETLSHRRLSACPVQRGVC